MTVEKSFKQAIIMALFNSYAI